MGGWAALGLALAHGDRVRSLVLADTLGGIPVEGWWKAPRRRAARRTLQSPRVVERLLRRASASAHTCTCRSAGSAATRSPIRRRSCARLGDVTFADDQLATLRVPTLFVVGTEDEIFPPAWIADAAARIPGARVEVVPDAGHSPYFEQPEAWNALVREFCSGVTRGTHPSHRREKPMNNRRSTDVSSSDRHPSGGKRLLRMGTAAVGTHRRQVKGERDDLRRGVARSQP